MGHARHLPDGNIELLGRDSEVVAIVQLRASTPKDSALLHEVAAKTLTRYKLPKAYIFVDEIMRSPSGKADYR